MKDAPACWGRFRSELTPASRQLAPPPGRCPEHEPHAGTASQPDLDGRRHWAAHAPLHIDDRGEIGTNVLVAHHVGHAHAAAEREADRHLAKWVEQKARDTVD